MQNRARFQFDYTYRTEKIPLGPYTLFQIGDLNCEPGYEGELHDQFVYEISYIVSGEGTFIVDGQSYPVRRGTVFINTIGDAHNVVSSSIDPVRFMYIGFCMRDDVPLPEPVRLLEAFYREPTVRMRENLFDVQESFIALLSEFVSEDAFTETLKECRMHELLCQVYRLMRTPRADSYQMRSGMYTDKSALVYDITHYIDEHIGTLTRLGMLCDVFGYSYTYIASIFSNVMKESLNAYYTRRRFEKAFDYLQKGVSVTETAQLMGYQSIHAFSHAFKKRFGKTPSACFQGNPTKPPEPKRVI